MFAVDSSSTRPIGILSMARAIIAIALAPSSGAIPACAALPTNRAVKRRVPGARVTTSPTGPPASNTMPTRASIAAASKAFEPLCPTSSPTVNTTSIGAWSISAACAARSASTTAATPALSSAPSTLDPSDLTASSSTTGVIPVVGRTVSMCAFSITRATGGAAAWPAAHDVPDRVLLERDPQRLENRPDDRRHPLLVAEVAVHRAHPHEQIEHAVEVDHPVVGLRVHGVDVSRGCGRRHCVPSTTDEASVATVRVPMRRRLRQMPPTPVDRLV